MNKNTRFFRQAEQMLRLLPIVQREECFALKGGTAINFFIRDMPRLSVDIDLTYLPIDGRDVALANISAALARISKEIQRAFKGTKVIETRNRTGTNIAKLIVSPGAYQVKIEPNEVLRGVLYGSEDRETSASVQKTFEMASTARCVSIEDLYGGKLCAMLDRQHPRDLFDVKELLANEGITKSIRRAFVVYLAGHNRPMDELLAPTWLDREKLYEREFIGMTAKPVAYNELVGAREACLAILRKTLDDRDKRFLLSMMQQEPDWKVIGIANLEKLPSLQWKLQNIAKMADRKREAAMTALKKAIGA
jgi:predicted nucleotidyltransferase component of viral defense system